MSTPTTRYDIITADSENHLSEDVTRHLALGWQLQGGVSVSPEQRAGRGQMVFAQAMTLAETPQPT